MTDLPLPFNNISGGESAAMRELKAAGFETLLFFPGIDFERWCQVLLREYTEEVVDALGDDADSVMESLREIWTDYYEDETTGITRKFSEWAVILRNQAMVQNYYKLVDEANKERPLK